MIDSGANVSIILEHYLKKNQLDKYMERTSKTI